MLICMPISWTLQCLPVHWLCWEQHMRPSGNAACSLTSLRSAIRMCLSLPCCRGLIGYILTCLPWQMRQPQSYFRNMFAGSRDISEIQLEQGQMLVQHPSHRPPFSKHWLLQYFTRST